MFVLLRIQLYLKISNRVTVSFDCFKRIYYHELTTRVIYTLKRRWYEKISNFAFVDISHSKHTIETLLDFTMNKLILKLYEVYTLESITYENFTQSNFTI